MLEGRHRAGSGNTLRAAVLGANDGLVSNLSLVMGVAGAAAAESTLVLTGLAGLVAGACSMAMGEWLSVTSSREMNQKQIATEADELREAPDEEKEELVLIYQAKGLDEAQARVLADKLLSNKDTALDTLARRTRHRSRGAGRLGLAGGRLVLPAVLAGRDRAGGAVHLPGRHNSLRGEPCRERHGVDDDRGGHQPVHWTIDGVLCLPSAGDRRGRRGDHLRRGQSGRRVVELISRRRRPRRRSPSASRAALPSRRRCCACPDR